MGADTFLLLKTKNRYENIGHIENGYVSYTGCVAWNIDVNLFTLYVIQSVIFV